MIPKKSLADAAPILRGGIFNYSPDQSAQMLNMKIPRPDEDSREFFRSVLPDDPRVSVRPMFGNISGFVNGNMFAGLFGNDLFVRLSDEDRQGLLKKKGASLLEPMKGKPMKEYVLIPRTWRDQPETVRLWVSKSLDWASKLPQKKTKR